MKRPVNILICPLDWGIGHASRMIPLIDAFLQPGYHVMIAAGGKSRELLRTEFPNAEFLAVPSVAVTYSRNNSQILKLLIQVPRLLFSIYHEHRWLKRTIPVHQLDIVLSDNRYGLWNRNITSVLLTHQVFPILPPGLQWFQPVFHVFFRLFISKFDRCLIPDTADAEMNLTGRLSHGKPLPHRAEYLGILSRFANPTPVAIKEHGQVQYDILVIISGPEPQRSIFEDMLLAQLRDIPGKNAIIRGLPGSNSNKVPARIGNTDLFDHLSRDTFRELILHAGIILCRSGYSTIMDLVELDKTAILIPTPGQPEQEYLAGYLSRKGFFYRSQQKDFDLKKTLQSFKDGKISRSGFPATDAGKYLLSILKSYHDQRKNSQKTQQETDVDLAGGM